MTPTAMMPRWRRSQSMILQRFHRRYYVAENAIVAIVGAVDRKTAESIAEQVTGGLAAGQHAPPLPPVPTVSGGELHEAFPSSQTHIYVGQSGNVAT